MAAAPALAASRKISRGWTMLASTRPDRHDRRPEDSVLGVEQHDAELLDRPAAILRQQHLGQDARGRDLDALAADAGQRAAPQFDGRDDLRRPRGADSWNATKLVVPGAREPIESARRRSSTALARSSALAFARPCPKHDRQQLVVAERRRTHALQLLARAIVRRDGLHRTPSLLYFRPDAPRCCPAVCSLPLRRLLRATAERNRSSARRHRHRARGRR